MFKRLHQKETIFLALPIQTFSKNQGHSFNLIHKNNNLPYRYLYIIPLSKMV